MPLMNSKKIKWFVWAGAVTAILGFALMVSISVFVPSYLENRLIPKVAQKYGLDTRQVEMRRIGWFGADLGPVHLDGADTPVLRIAAAHFDYSPFSLLRGRIKRITLGGVRVVIAATEEGLSVPGLTLPPKVTAEHKPAALPDLGTLIPVAVEEIRLDQSEVVLLWKGRPLTLSMDVALACGELNKGRLNGSAELSLLGSTLALTAALDQHANTATLTMENGTFALGALAGIIDLPASMALSSNAALKGRSSFRLAPFELKDLSLTGQLLETQIALNDVTLQNLPASQGALKPIMIAIEAPEPPAIQWHSGPFLINGPVSAHILYNEGKWAPGQQGWSLDGMMKTLLPVQTLTDGMALTKDVPITWKFQAGQTDNGALAFDAHTTDDHPMVLKMTPFDITCPTYQIKTTSRFDRRRFSAEAVLTANKIHIGAPDGEIIAAELTANSTLSRLPGDAPSPTELIAKVAVTGIRLKRGATQVDVPRLDISAHGKQLHGQPWHYKSHLKMVKAAVSDKAHGIRLRDIQIDMPLLWPPQHQEGAGTLNVKNIHWRKHRLGNLKGRLQQKERALEISLRHNSKLFPNLNVLINGRIDADGTALKAKLPSYQFPEAIDLGRFVPQAAGTMANGIIEADAELSFNNRGLNGSASLKIDQGRLHDAQRELGLEGIHMRMVLNDILAQTSAPQQKLRVDRLSFGKIVAEDLEFDFRLEGPQTLFIEKSLIQWCRGRIHTTALRIAPDKETYDVTLFCDRLNLAMVLEQLGAGQASGEGTVNGSIPIHWHKGRLSFDNGFLYSTPGQPGAIQLTGTEVLLSGLPPETPQYAQVDIATEALKDYTYNWAKLSVSSQDDDLMLKLQFDGKPNRLLPFAFDQQLGRLKRVVGEGQADFKGISIDLNITSPLDKILHYKKLLTPNQ